MDHIDFIAVTVGPGLEPALWTGIEFAKKLAKKYESRWSGRTISRGIFYSFLLPEQKKTGFMNSRFKNQESISCGRAHRKRWAHCPVFALFVLEVAAAWRNAR